MTEERLYRWLAVGGLIFLVYLLAPILTPFVASALLAYVGDPLVDRLEKLKLSRTVSVIIVFFLTMIGISALVLLIVPLVRDQGMAFATKLPTYVQWVEENLLPKVTPYLGLEGGTLDMGLGPLVSEYAGRLGSFASTAFGTLTRSGGAFIGGIVTAFLIPILTFYLLRDWDHIVRRMGKLIPPGERDAMFSLARESDEVLGGFLRGQILVMLGLATIYSIGLSIVGLDYAIAIGVVAGLVSFVPYLGLVVGIILAGLSALAQLQSIGALAAVVAVFVVGQMIEGTLLTPKLVGDRIGLHPVLVIFAVMAGGQLFGFFGILLALPGAAVVSVIVRHVYGRFGEPEPDELVAADGEDNDAD
ncbi:MAG: AI-2E family transporter [Gammaproteobacteria bacterium]